MKFNLRRLTIILCLSMTLCGLGVAALCYAVFRPRTVSSGPVLVVVPFPWQGSTRVDSKGMTCVSIVRRPLFDTSSRSAGFADIELPKNVNWDNIVVGAKHVRDRLGDPPPKVQKIVVAGHDAHLLREYLPPQRLRVSAWIPSVRLAILAEVPEELEPELMAIIGSIELRD